MITGLPLIMQLRRHVHQNPQFRMFHPFVIELLLLSTALPFVAAKRELSTIFFPTQGGWPGVGLSALALTAAASQGGGSLLCSH